MTRETKVGLVVATSFLGLVGVVVAARMSTTDVPAKKGRLAEARTENKTKPPESSPAEPAEKKDGKGENKVVIATHETPGTTPPPLNLNVSGPLAGTEPVLTPNPKPAVAPPAVVVDPVEQQKKIEELKKQTLLAQGTPPPLLKETPAGPPSLLPSDPSKNSVPGAITPTVVPDKKLEAKSDLTKPEGPGPLAKPEAVDPKPGVSPDPAGKPLVTPGPIPNNTAPLSPAAVPGPESKPLVTTGPPNSTPEVKPANSTPGGGAPPPIGSAPPVSSPPIAVALAAGQGNSNTLPQVKQYDINAYSIKPEDRSFGDISQKLYGSDKYARALVLFNRDHPQATEGIRQEPPQVRAGTPVFFPPKEELERNYAPAISAATPAGPTPAAPANSSPISMGAPTPLGAVTPGNPNAVAAAPPGTNVWTEPGGGKNYRVNNNGEHIFEVARNALGDGSRWSEIYRLNPTINPQFPVPAGTVLKLP